MKNIKRIQFLVFVIFIIIITFFSYKIATNQNFVIRNYEIKTNKITSDQSFRIAMLTDLHSRNYGNEQSDLINLISSGHADLTVMVGDIFEDTTRDPFKNIIPLLPELNKLGPTYYVTGNHENRLSPGKYQQALNLLKQSGTIVLQNESTPYLSNTIIAGINDPEDKKFLDIDQNQQIEQISTTLTPLATSSAKFQILLAHRPEKIDLYDDYSIDLILSGHAHGGQMIIPGLVNGLYAPNQGFFPSRAGGLYQDRINLNQDKTSHIIGRGMVQNSFPPRVFNPPEIIFIDIIGTKTN